ncbi:GNAT family N-acetyltransferase [Yinghuangia sp. YIM S09857]|uniref:GNAT family N-acetyltransferase n=1 Tax=Yinghuangia sp. YIM S09857 TaxID=3436929 RepID=UPI003F529983
MPNAAAGREREDGRRPAYGPAPPLTLTAVADDPALLTYRLSGPDGSALVLRPLEHADADRLAAFLTGLSAETRRLSTFDGYDLAAARDLCAAIARYDKLRLVLEHLGTTTEGPSPAEPGPIVGLFELSLDLPPHDIARYRRAGIRLTPADCRFGPTLADDHQGRGTGSRVFPLVADVARRFGRQRVILWGGVLADNPRAIRHYTKHGFRTAGAFTGPDGTRSLDMILDLADAPAPADPGAPST